MIKLLSLFSGIGAFEKALENIGIDYELVNYCEIDKFASKSYALIHNVNENKNLKDVTKVDTSKLPNDIDLVTYGFPCQDISVAGKMKGFEDGNGNRTRSGLFFEALRIIEDTKPKVAIAENVKALTGKKFKKEFNTVLKSLDEAGYNCYWKVLNAKDYGVPQNRERVFIVSIRKDIDNELFEFPKPYSLEKRLKDFLEPHVDEKYYLSDAQITRMKTTPFVSNSFKVRVSGENEVCNTLCARDYKDSKCVIVPNATKRGYAEAYDGDSVDLAYPDRTTRRGRVKEGVSGTLTTSDNMGVVVEDKPKVLGGIGEKKSNGGKQWYQQDRVYDNNIGISITSTFNPYYVDNSLKIRKLTPKECYRLMGFSDEEFERAEKFNSNTQLYKQAGNSIVVDVLEALFKELFNAIYIGESEVSWWE